MTRLLPAPQAGGGLRVGVACPEEKGQPRSLRFRSSAQNAFLPFAAVAKRGACAWGGRAPRLLGAGRTDVNFGSPRPCCWRADNRRHKPERRSRPQGSIAAPLSAVRRSAPRSTSARPRSCLRPAAGERGLCAGSSGGGSVVRAPAWHGRARRTLTPGVPGAVASGANPNVPRLPWTPGRGGRWVPRPFSSAQMPKSGDHRPGIAGRAQTVLGQEPVHVPPTPAGSLLAGAQQKRPGAAHKPGQRPSRRLAPPRMVARVQGLLASTGHGQGQQRPSRRLAQQVPPPEATKRGQGVGSMLREPTPRRERGAQHRGRVGQASGQGCRLRAARLLRAAGSVPWALSPGGGPDGT